MRNRRKFTYETFRKNEEVLYGFDAFIKELDRTIVWQERGRREYEVGVADVFETDINKLEKWDTYSQAKPNMTIIAHEVIRQYKEQLKKEDMIESIKE